MFMMQQSQITQPKRDHPQFDSILDRKTVKKFLNNSHHLVISGGALVYSVNCNWRVVGSNPPQATT